MYDFRAGSVKTTLAEVSTNDMGNGEALKDLLDQIEDEIEQVSMDGAYAAAMILGEYPTAVVAGGILCDESSDMQNQGKVVQFLVS